MACGSIATSVFDFQVGLGPVEASLAPLTGAPSSAGRAPLVMSVLACSAYLSSHCKGCARADEAFEVLSEVAEDSGTEWKYMRSALQHLAWAIAIGRCE